MSEREDLERALAALEGQRALLGDAVVDAGLAAIREKLARMEGLSPTIVVPPETTSPTEPTPATAGGIPTEMLQRLIPREFAARLLATQGQVGSERRLVTMLFSDVKGSTALAEDLDPEEVLQIMNGAFEFLIAPIYRHEGTLARLMGDAILAFFGAPIGHEDDPERACRAALEIVAGAQEYAARLEKERGIHGFNVRVGINTGLVVVGQVGSDLRVEYTAMGDAVNLAARLEQAAPVGGILISHDTYRHVRGLFDVLAQEPLPVKGKRDPVQTYIVQRARPQAFRMPTRGVEGIETPMVGREEELRSLQQSFSEAVEKASTHLVFVIGEAGIGKSRLLLEFENWLALQPGPLLFLQGRAIAQTTTTPYATLRNLFSNYLEIAESDDAATAQGKFEAGVGAYLTSAQAQLVGHLIGFDFSNSEAVRNMAGTSLAGLAQLHLLNYFRNLTAEHAVVLCFEDLHWADDSSLDLIFQLATELPARHLFILGLARPTLRERRPDLALSSPPAQLISLSLLSPDSTRTLVEEILRRVASLPDDLRELIVKSAEGNPFYVEELINMLIDDGVIRPGEEGWQVEMERLKKVRVPSTLAGILQARLDNLAPEEKEVLQRAAVVGRTFWDSALAELGNKPIKEIDSWIEATRRRELVFRAAHSTLANAREYSFKHALLRDVTYETVLLKVRRIYHRRVADWLEQNSRDRQAEYSGLIAEHYEQAGEKDAAVRWLYRGGKEAVQRGAFREAIALLERARGLASGDDPAQSAAILVDLGHAYEKVGNYPQARACDHAGEKLARQAGALPLASYALVGLSMVAGLQGDFDEATAYANEALTLARQSGDRMAYARALMRAGGYIKDPQEQMRHYVESLAIFRELGGKNQVGVCLLNMGNAALDMYDLDTAVRYYEQSLAEYRQAGNLWGIGNCLANLGLVAYERRDYAAAVRYNEESLAIARQIDDHEGTALCLLNLGWSHVRLGNQATADRCLRESLAEAKALGTVPIVLLTLVAMADLLLQTGQPVRAAELVGLAQNHPARSGLDVVAGRVLEALRQVLSEEEMEGALERGKGMELDTVVAEYLSQ